MSGPGPFADLGGRTGLICAVPGISGAASVTWAGAASPIAMIATAAKCVVQRRVPCSTFWPLLKVLTGGDRLGPNRRRANPREKHGANGEAETVPGRTAQLSRCEHSPGRSEAQKGEQRAG